MCGVRRKVRGNALEPKSNPHGIQVDLPKYSANIQVPSSSIRLHPALSCKGELLSVGVKQRGCCSGGGYTQGLHVEEEQIPLNWASALGHKGQR